MLKTVTVGKRQMAALVDTGCDRNLIRREAFDQLNIGLNTSLRIELTGIANSVTVTMGAAEIDLVIDGCRMTTLVHVVSNYVIPMDLMLGRDFFRKVIVIISHGEMKIFKDFAVRRNYARDILRQLDDLYERSREDAVAAKTDALQRQEEQMNQQIVNTTYYSELISMYCELLVEFQVLLEEYQTAQRELKRAKDHLKNGSLTFKI